MYDAILIVPPNRAFTRYRAPVTYLHLGGYLTHFNHKVLVVDEQEFHDLYYVDKIALADRIARKVSGLKSKIIGMSCYSHEYPVIKHLAKQLKAGNPDSLIVVGGLHPTLYPQAFFYDGAPFDIAVLGEGELPLKEILDHLDGKRELASIKGIAYRRNGQVHFNDKSSISPSVDDFTFPDYSLVDMKFYTTPNAYAFRGIYLSSFYFFIGRGCPSNCSFCVNKNIKNYMGSKPRNRSAEKVVDDILRIRSDYKIDGFYILDDAFTINREYVHGFCDELIKRKVNLLWAAQSRINAINHDYLKHMREAGCIQLDFGVESGSPRMLALMRKGIKIQWVEEVFDNCHALGIRPLANILFNHPGEEKEDIDLTFKLIDRIKPSITYFNIFMPTPGCDLAEKNNITYTDEEIIKMEEMGGGLSQKDPKYHYGNHDIDIVELVRTNHFKYNKLSSLIRFMFTGVYIRQLLRSKRKISYLVAAFALAKEFFRQIYIWRLKPLLTKSN